MKHKKRRKYKRGKFKKVINSILEMGLFFLVVLILTFILSKYVVERLVIHNHSMENTIMNGDNILIDKISYRFTEPSRFDIIIFRQNGTGEVLIKRVIGLPHETIQIKEGIIYINGESIKDVKGLDAPDDPGMAYAPITLSEGEYFVIGDNREESIDSRSEEVGLVTNTRIIGRLFMRILPLSDIKIF